MPGMPTPAAKKAEAPAATDADELRALRARLEELERRTAK